MKFSHLIIKEEEEEQLDNFEEKRFIWQNQDKLTDIAVDYLGQYFTRPVRKIIPKFDSSKVGSYYKDTLQVNFVFNEPSVQASVMFQTLDTNMIYRSGVGDNKIFVLVNGAGALFDLPHVVSGHARIEIDDNLASSIEKTIKSFLNPQVNVEQPTITQKLKAEVLNLLKQKYQPFTYNGIKINYFEIQEIEDDSRSSIFNILFELTDTKGRRQRVTFKNFHIMITQKVNGIQGMHGFEIDVVTLPESFFNGHFEPLETLLDNIDYNFMKALRSVIFNLTENGSIVGN